MFAARSSSLALALLAAGCSAPSPAVTVGGRVVYKGSGEAVTRLAGGYVCLEAVGDAGRKPVGQIEDDGTFSLGTVADGKNLGGVLPGEYRARVVPPENAETGKLAAGVIDPRYQSFEKSGLTVTIRPDTKEVTIEVEKPRR